MLMFLPAGPAYSGNGSSSRPPRRRLLRSIKQWSCPTWAARVPYEISDCHGEDFEDRLHIFVGTGPDEVFDFRFDPNSLSWPSALLIAVLPSGVLTKQALTQLLLHRFVLMFIATFKQNSHASMCFST